VLTDVDREEFQRAIQLIQSIVSRHSAETTAPLLVALQLAVHDINVVQKYLASVNTEKC
jgi:hypothetical protein